MTRKGLGRQLSRTLLHDSWPRAVGEPWAKYTQVGALRRGVLEVLVDNSTFVQELGFRKEEILKTLRPLVPDEYITDLRFRVGPIYTS